MRALAFERVHVEGQRRDERLALAGPHLGDVPSVQREAAHQLDVEVALLQRPLRRFADGRERLREDVVDHFALAEPLAKVGRALGQLGV